MKARYFIIANFIDYTALAAFRDKNKWQAGIMSIYPFMCPSTHIRYKILHKSTVDPLDPESRFLKPELTLNKLSMTSGASRRGEGAPAGLNALLERHAREVGWLVASTKDLGVGVGRRRDKA